MKHCVHCGKIIINTAKFCGSCGAKIIREQSKGVAKSKKSKNANLDKTSMIAFKIDKKTYDRQVIHYDDLKISESFRGISSLLLLFSAVVTIIFVMTGLSEVWSLIDAVLVVVLGYFIYYGKQWSMIIAMIYWTISKASAVFSDSGNFLVQFLWWVGYMRYFYGAYKIEKIRHYIYTRGDSV